MRRRRRIWREKGWQDRDERAALTYKMRLALVQPSPSRKPKNQRTATACSTHARFGALPLTRHHADAPLRPQALAAPPASRPRQGRPRHRGNGRRGRTRPNQAAPAWGPMEAAPSAARAGSPPLATRRVLDATPSRPLGRRGAAAPARALGCLATADAAAMAADAAAMARGAPPSARVPFHLAAALAHERPGASRRRRARGARPSDKCQVVARRRRGRKLSQN